MTQDITLKNINKLAIPALIAGIAEPILSLTDTAIIGNVDYNAAEALAAVGIVGTFISMLIWVFGQTRSAISSIVSQHLGADKLEQVKNLPAQAIFIITSISILIILTTWPFASQIFKLYNASDLILDYSIDYYRIRVFGFPFTLFTIAVFGTFRGLQNTFYPMIIAIVGTIVNIILDVILVYGIEDFIAPMHIEGAAYASVCAQITMALLSVFYLLRKTSISLRLQLPFNDQIENFILMVANLFVRTLALNVTLYFATRFATSYGTEYIAAYTIAINLWFLGAFIIDGYASAGNILSGKLLGEKNYKKLVELSQFLIQCGLVVGIILCFIGVLTYNWTGALFTEDEAVLKQFNRIYWMVLIMQPFCALAFIFDGMFKGMGKMKFLRNLLLLSTGLVFIPLLFLFDNFDLKLHAIFIALTFWILARGIPLIIKFRQLFLSRSQKM